MGSRKRKRLSSVRFLRHRSRKGGNSTSHSAKKVLTASGENVRKSEEIHANKTTVAGRGKKKTHTQRLTDAVACRFGHSNEESTSIPVCQLSPQPFVKVGQLRTVASNISANFVHRSSIRE